MRTGAVGAGPLHPVTAGWVLKRALLGVVILTAMMGSFAWLTYTAVGGADDTAAGTPSARDLQNIAEH